jgi:phosphatidylserine/phosphatidylglycerophosphate/cardiolipin synthase-like enzyme
MSPTRRAAPFLSICAVLLALLLPPEVTGAQDRTALTNPWEVHFSPNGDCTDAILRELARAKTSILVQAYSFTSAPIAKGLIGAHKRGVKVEVVLDKSQRSQKYSSATFLFNAGVPTRIDAMHAINHNKVIIIDGETLITGSFNFTKAAEEKNAENLLILRDRKLASEYAKNWQFHAAHSEPYVGKGG